MVRRKAESTDGGDSAGPDAEALRRHIRARGAEYLRDPNITSVGIGRKNGDGPISIQFTVGVKGDASVIEALGSAVIPETIEVDGHPVSTDVIERTYRPSYDLVQPQAIDARRARMDPVRPGISVCHRDGTAGTLGLVVFDRATGAPCVLSNWHVLNGIGGEIGDAIVQPGPFDDNNTVANGMGALLRSHLGPAGDCALARIRQRDFDPAIFGLDVVPRRMARVQLDDKVIKSGRTTDVTRGLVRRVDVMARIAFDPPLGPQAIGGFEIGPDPDHPAPDGEISKGGDSGAAWLIAEEGKATDIFAGLHFAGEAGASADEHALACYSASVQQKLDFVLAPPQADGDALPGAAAFRTGYDAGFLGVAAPEPGLTTALKRDAVNFGRAQAIPYTHFSVCLSARRRMARYVAWNVDGARMVKLPRRGFALDPRIDARHQLDDTFYAGNRLDRGHIARRADLCWGGVEEARQANADSFFFTNIAPQHERFNQSGRKGLWGELENLVFEQADMQDIRLSAQGGPVFGEEDPSYRGVQIPRAFWKLIAYVGGDGKLRCSSFVLSQEDLLNDIEAIDLDPFRIYQVSLSDLGQRTGLDFSALAAGDVMRHPDIATRGSTLEAVMAGRRDIVEIRSAAEIVL